MALILITGASDGLGRARGVTPKSAAPRSTTSAIVTQATCTVTASAVAATMKAAQGGTRPALRPVTSRRAARAGCRPPGTPRIVATLSPETTTSMAQNPASAMADSTRMTSRNP
jgi:hypothetical protein